MVGDSDWTEQEIIDEDRIVWLVARLVNTETGEVHAQRVAEVSSRLQRLDFITDYKIVFQDARAEHPELQNAKLVVLARVNY